MKVLEAVGKRFGTVMVLNRVGSRNGKALWNCVCDCGHRLDAVSHQLSRGYQNGCKSCVQITHGKTGHPIYRVWNQMISRCTRPKNISYPNYGGRGISVCSRWFKFENFFKDMGDRPFKGAEIDRINNNGNYEPSNCHWTTRKGNMLNRQDSKIWHIKGRTFDTAKDAGEYFNRSACTIIQWCYGQTTRGRSYPPVENCYTEALYENTH